MMNRSAITWDLSTYRTSEQRKFIQSCANVQFYQSLRCLNTKSLDEDEHSSINWDIKFHWIHQSAPLIENFMHLCISIQISCVCPIYCLNIYTFETYKWTIMKEPYERNRRSYMSAHVLLNLFNKLGKRDKMGGLPSILSFPERV